MRAHAERFNVGILPDQTVTKVESHGNYKIVETESDDSYCGRSLLLMTDATYRGLNVLVEEDLIGVGIHFCATCDNASYEDKELVVGRGYNGVEEGLFLTKCATKVTI